MSTTFVTSERILNAALDAARQGRDALKNFDDLPTAIYATDSDGHITYYNRACVNFSGRTPEVGIDHWCVSWKLYTPAGEFLPHEECPMAVAIKQKHPIRGVEAIAERPDGSRVRFLPHPTPVFDEEGSLVGAINMMINLTDLEQAEELQAQATKCRRLAASVDDSRTAYTLTLMAAEYEQKASGLQQFN